MTHVELQPDLLPLLGRVDNVLDVTENNLEHTLNIIKESNE